MNSCSRVKSKHRWVWISVSDIIRTFLKWHLCICGVFHRSPGRFVLNNNDPKKDALAKLKDAKSPPGKVSSIDLHWHVSPQQVCCIYHLNFRFPYSYRKSSHLLLHRLWSPQGPPLLPPMVLVSFPATCRRNRATWWTCSAQRSPNPFQVLLQNLHLPLLCMKRLSSRISLTHLPQLPPHSVSVC